MKQWQTLALSLCLGLITGGGMSAAVASAKLAAVRAELRAEINEVRLAKDMLRATAKGCYIRAKQAAKKKGA